MKRRRVSERGSLATTLFVITFIIAVAFSLALMSYQHWLFSRRAHNRQIARNLAESAAALTVARMVGDPSANDDDGLGSFGTRDDIKSVVTLTAPGTPVLSTEQALAALDRDPSGGEGIAYVCFAPSVKTRHRLARLSRHNTTDASVPGVDLRIPPHAAQVIAHGVCHGEVQEIETVIYVPPLPLALMASGPISTTGKVEVTGLREVQAFNGSVESIPPQKRAHVTVVSNSGAAPAIRMAAAAIYGSLQTVGTVSLGRNTFVSGGVRQHANPEDIPDINVDSIVKQVEGNAYTLEVSSSGDLTVDWPSKSSGSLTVNGDLSLEGGTLCVNGNLHVTGCVKGDGCVAVKGSTTIDKGATLNADNVVALLSCGPISLKGTSRTSSFIQGLVYSESGVSASHLTILGGLITNSARTSADAGVVSLDDATVVASPLATKKIRANAPFKSDLDDDVTIYTGYVKPDASDLTGRRKVYRGTAIAYWNNPHDKDEPYDRANVGRFMSTNISDIVQGIKAYDLATEGGITDLLIVNTGNNITSRGREGEVYDYFRRLALGDPSTTLVEIDVNRLLKTVKRPRFLLWRPL